MSDKIIDNKNLMKEWNYEKNKEIKPNEISPYSHKKVWWICERGHEWQASISNRSKGNKCPYCSGKKAITGENDFATLYPEIAKEWNYEKNKEIKPNEILPSSHKKVWWICEKGHEWQEIIGCRTVGYGCPYCSGKRAIKGINDFQTVHPELMSEWNYKKNIDIKPDEILPSINKKVWWICEKGHEWQASINNRHKGTGCPICSTEMQSSFPEQTIMFYLSKQLHVENRYICNGKEIDVYLPDFLVGIEYDGLYYHNSEKAKQKEKDKEKVLKDNNIFLIRIKESNKFLYDKDNHVIYYKPKHSYENLEEVLEIITKILNFKFNVNLKIDFNIKRDTTKILNMYKFLKKQNSIYNKNKKLLKEWNYEKNKNLNPEFFDVNSRYKVWWKCRKGHEWQASIYSRNIGSGCPYCSGLLALSGENDLNTLYPQLMREWNYKRNKDINPNEILPKSSKKVWWICEKGHEWQAVVSNRTNGNNCPYCSGKKVLKGFNDLKTWCIKNNYKHLIDEFDYEKNQFKIDEITFGSGKKVWWKCKKGHSYETYLSHRTKMNTGCPYCSNQKVLIGYNDLATTNPILLEEWNYEKNTTISPTSVTKGSRKKVWWRCKKCNYEWKASISYRSNSLLCPKCRKKIL